MSLAIKRVYDPASPSDGFRVLVDRLWPRGLTKERAAVDLWCKALAPSPDLRKWFGHDPARWNEFREQYNAELESRVEDAREVLEIARKQKVTLVYGARDPVHNHAIVLLAYLRRISTH